MLQHNGVWPPRPHFLAQWRWPSLHSTSSVPCQYLPPFLGLPPSWSETPLFPLFPTEQWSRRSTPAGPLPPGGCCCSLAQGWGPSSSHPCPGQQRSLACEEMPFLPLHPSAAALHQPPSRLTWPTARASCSSPLPPDSGPWLSNCPNRPSGTHYRGQWSSLKDTPPRAFQEVIADCVSHLPLHSANHLRSHGKALHAPQVGTHALCMPGRPLTPLLGIPSGSVGSL